MTVDDEDKWCCWQWRRSADGTQHTHIGLFFLAIENKYDEKLRRYIDVSWFWMLSFTVTLLLKIDILTIKTENPRKIPTGHELNQVVKFEGSLL